ncbi:DUF6003 family protein [Streptomyces albidoflavus]|uniref:DUF6003 family protein n=1 Tax=Streptomyces albidoflavus TaxID=1886 RepID=UPI0033276F85
MTDDAYLVLLEGPAVPLGTPLAATGPLACLDTPAVRAWLAAHEVTATSPHLYLVPPEETAALPEDAEKLPVPLSPEELSTVRTRNAPEAVAGVERELRAYRSCTEDREGLLRRALAAGVPAHRVAELTGEELTAVKAAAAERGTEAAAPRS